MIQSVNKSGNKDKNLTMCVSCGYEHDKKKEKVGIYQREMHKQDLPKFGYFFICDECAHKQYSYSTPNETIYGVPKKHGFRVSIELELDTDTFDSAFMYAYQYIPTSDCTVGTEWKSPIYEGLSAVPKLLGTIYGKLKDEKIDISNRCGTHFHISNVNFDNAFYSFLSRNYRQVFYAMHKEIDYHRNNFQELFGRELKGYCGLTQYWDSPSSHNNFISIRSNRIELRQPKFVNDKQYMDCLKLGRDLMNALYKEWTFTQDTNRMSKECVRILAQYTYDL